MQRKKDWEIFNPYNNVLYATLPSWTPKVVVGVIARWMEHYIGIFVDYARVGEGY